MRVVFISFFIMCALFAYAQSDNSWIGLDLITQLPNTKESIDNLNDLSNMVSSNNPNIALKYAKEAYKRSLSIDYQHGKAEALHYIGLAYDNLSQYNEAFSFYFESLKIK